MDWYQRHGSLSTASTTVSLTPEAAGWAYCGLHVADLRNGPFRYDLRGCEGVLIPLSARDIRVTVDGSTWLLKGRAGVFAAVSDWLYVPVGAELVVEGESGEIALCTAVASQRHPIVYTPAEQVSVEVRGSGRSTRQVTNIATPGSFTDAHRINVCEVLTPGGNWSCWPPHRHDGELNCPTMNEEIYYFRLGRGESLHGDPAATGLFRVYTVEGDHDESVSLGDGDVYIVPRGYHGPTVAPPEYPMYFLNVLAGPAEQRTMDFCDDPVHHWIRDSWVEQDEDPRCPMTDASGRVVVA